MYEIKLFLQYPDQREKVLQHITFLNENKNCSLKTKLGSAGSLIIETDTPKHFRLLAEMCSDTYTKEVIKNSVTLAAQ